MSLLTIGLLLILPLWVRLALAREESCAKWTDWKEVGCADACGGCGQAKLRRTCSVKPGCNRKCEGPSEKLRESQSCSGSEEKVCRFPNVVCCQSHRPRFDRQERRVLCVPKNDAPDRDPHIAVEKEDSERPHGGSDRKGRGKDEKGHIGGDRKEHGKGHHSDESAEEHGGHGKSQTGKGHAPFGDANGPKKQDTHERDDRRGAPKDKPKPVKESAAANSGRGEVARKEDDKKKPSHFWLG